MNATHIRAPDAWRGLPKPECSDVVSSIDYAALPYEATCVACIEARANRREAAAQAALLEVKALRARARALRKKEADR